MVSISLARQRQKPEPNEPEMFTAVLNPLAELVLSFKYFSIHDEHYQQIIVAAVGPKRARTILICLLHGFMEKQIFDQYTDPIPDHSIMFSC